jgi:mannosyltransferase
MVDREGQGPETPEIVASDPRRHQVARSLTLAGILTAAAILRFWHLGEASLWYDEVVTMRVARAGGLAAMVDCLDRVDGTRAPLHPMILRAWLALSGPSDLAGRAFSALCGLATVGLVYRIGRDAFDHRTGLWAAWLTAVCPPLVYYSQEARMYAWLVLLTASSWRMLLSFRHEAPAVRCVLYAVLLAALGYSHPLGLFMIGAHGLAFLVARRGLKLGFGRWLLIQLVVALALAPWLRRYLDHGTDYPIPRYSLKYLLAVPIEYVGGNSLVLAVCLGIVALGLLRLVRDPGGGRPRPTIDHPVENAILVVWAVAAPLAMYVDSHLGQPIFGPSRYHLFIAPAYLLLLAHGLTRLPSLLRWPLAAAGLALSLTLLHGYSPTLKADWRGLASWLDGRHPEAGTHQVVVAIHPSDPRFPREQVEAARYYLDDRYRVAAAGSDQEAGPLARYEIFCLTRPRPTPDDGPARQEFHGLIVR